MSVEFKSLHIPRNIFPGNKSPLSSPISHQSSPSVCLSQSSRPPLMSAPSLPHPGAHWPHYSPLQMAALLNQHQNTSTAPSLPSSGSPGGSTGPSSGPMPHPQLPGSHGQGSMMPHEGPHLQGGGPPMPGGIPPSLVHLAGGTSLMENWENWRQFQQAAYANNLDPHLLAFYHNGGCPVDLTNAPRRKNATRETTSMLKAWLNEHRKNPYPTKGEKIMLAIITKMTLTQVSTWFANARRRLKKENKMTWSPRNRSEEERERGSGSADGGHPGRTSSDHRGSKAIDSEGEDNDFDDEAEERDTSETSRQRHSFNRHSAADVGDLDDFDEEDRETLKRLESSAAVAGFFNNPGFNPSLFPGFLAAQANGPSGFSSLLKRGGDQEIDDEMHSSKSKKPKIWSIVDTASKEREECETLNNDAIKGRSGIEKELKEGSLLSGNPFDFQNRGNSLFMPRGFPPGHHLPNRYLPPGLFPHPPTSSPTTPTANFPPLFGGFFGGNMPPHAAGMFLGGPGGNMMDAMMSGKMLSPPHGLPTFPTHSLLSSRHPGNMGQLGYNANLLRSLSTSSVNSLTTSVSMDSSSANAMALASAAAGYLCSTAGGGGGASTGMANPMTVAALMSAMRGAAKGSGVTGRGGGMGNEMAAAFAAIAASATGDENTPSTDIPHLFPEVGSTKEQNIQKCSSVNSSASPSPSK